jgi:predicted dehydrogenase
LRGATVEQMVDLSQDFTLPSYCDAVLILDSADVEVRFMERCLSAGKHVLVAVEQSWLSTEALETLLLTAQQSQVQLALMNLDRFLPSRRLIRQQLDAGTLGEPGLVRLHRWEPVMQQGPGIPGELPRALARDLDLTISLMGRLPELVYAVARTNGPGDPAGGCCLVHLGFAGGGMAIIDYADLVPGDDYVSLSVIGSLGAAYADDHQNMQLVYRGGHPHSIRAEESGTQLLAFVQEFVDGLGAGRDFSASVAAWRGVQGVAECVRQSLAEHRAIHFR